MSSLFQGLVDGAGRVRIVDSPTSPTGVVSFRGMYITPDGQVIATPDTGQSRVHINGIAFEDPSGILLVSQGLGPWTTVPGGVLVDAAGAVKIDSVSPVDVIHQGVGLLNDGTLCVGIDQALGPELCTNSNLDQWTNDNPDGFVVSTEDAGNYVTEVPGVGARMATDGNLIAMRWFQDYNGANAYRCTIQVESVTGSWDQAFMRTDWNPAGEPVNTVTTPGTQIVEALPPGVGWYAGMKRTFGAGAGQVVMSRFSIKELL